MNFLLRRGLPWTFLLLALTAAAAESVRVDNGAFPSQTIRNWHLMEEWRAGPEEKGFLLGRIADLARDTAGRTYLLDYQQQETYVFDPAGKFLGQRGSKGEGPGETTMASNLLLGPGRFGLLNRFPAEIVWLDSQGDPAGSTRPHFTDDREGFLGGWYGRLRHGRIVLGMTRSLFDGKIKANLDYLVGCNFDGAITTIYRDFGEAGPRQAAQDLVDEGRLYDPLAGRWDLDERGRVWLAPERDRYLLQVIDETGTEVLAVSREYQAPTRSEAEKQNIRSSLERKWGKTGLPIEVAEQGPVIQKLWIMENPWGTEVWVESGASGHDLPPGVMVRYDLFNLEGEFTHQVDIVGEGDPLFDTWYLVGNNRLVMVRNATSGGYAENDLAHPRFNDAELEVISYRIVWEE